MSGPASRQPEPSMSIDSDAVRLELLAIEQPVRASLSELRPVFAKALPGILARYYEKVRQYDPASPLFRDGLMQEAIRLQLAHWDLIASGDFSAAYQGSAARLCELHRRAGVAPQWYVGCRLMFVAAELMKAAEAAVEIPRFGRAAHAARDKKAAM